MRDSLHYTFAYPLILASASPRRKAFFADLGIDVRIVTPASSAEPQPLKHEHPAFFAIRASCAKAMDVASLLLKESPKATLCHLPSTQESFFTAPPLSVDYPPVTFIPYSTMHAIIAADTVVACEGRIFGKPQDDAEALDFLSFLAGKTHQVYTGCCISTPKGACSFAVCTQVSMWNVPHHLLSRYVRSQEPLDKAGAYAIQGQGSFLVSSIHGSWSNVVGLPIAEVLQALLHYASMKATG